MNQTVDIQTARELREAGFPVQITSEYPTALEIVEQMPFGTHIKKNTSGDWVVSRALTQFYDDEHFDPCPHRAAALAFIAWKKGSN